jgi:hypothetical protein
MDRLQSPLSYGVFQMSEEARLQRGQDQHRLSSDVMTIEGIEESGSPARVLDMHNAMLNEPPKREVGRILGRSCETSYFSAA